MHILQLNINLMILVQIILVCQKYGNIIVYYISKKFPDIREIDPGPQS